MELDARSFTMAIAVVGLVLVLVFFVLARNFPSSVKGFRLWGVALVVGIASAVMLAARGFIPDIYSIVLGNALYTTMLALMITAISVFNNQIIPWKLPWFCVAVVLIGLTYFLDSEQSLEIRTNIAAWANIVLLCVAGWNVFKGMDGRKLRFGIYFTGTCFVATAIISFARVATLLGWGGGYVELMYQSTAQQLYLVSQVANVFLVSVGFAIMGQEKLVEGYYALATADELTGLRNRRHLIAVAERELQRAERYDRDVSLVLIDIDNVRHLNDTYGYKAGDLVIKDVANLIRQSFREVDLYGRYEGEKFVALLPETEVSGAEVISERVRAAMGQRRVKFEGSEITYTASFGIAKGQPDMRLDQIIGQAERAVDQAKNRGKDCVEVFKDEVIA